MKKLYAAIFTMAFLMGVVLPTFTTTAAKVPPTVVTHSLSTNPGPSLCPKTYTVAMAEHIARRVYARTRHITNADRKQLRVAKRCLINPQRAAKVSRYYDEQHKAHAQRVFIKNLPQATASWYDDAGATASGFHAHYGVAVCGSGGGPCVPFGTKILFVYNGKQVVATADDHGPYVSGRAFDLNQNVASALGFSGVDTVKYHIY